MLLSSIVNEKRSDFRAISSGIAKSLFSEFKEFISNGKPKAKSEIYIEQDDTPILLRSKFERVKNSNVMPKSKPWVIMGALEYKEDEGDVVDITVFINPAYYSKEHYNPTLGEFHDTVRHEMEHVAQMLGKRDSYRINMSSKKISMYDYLMKETELPAFVAGFYRRAQFEKKPIDVFFNEYLDTYNDKFKGKQRKKIFKAWKEIAKSKYPNAIYSK